MPNPMIKIYDSATDESIEREMNVAEYAEYKVNRDLRFAVIAADEATVAAKASGVAKLAALGFTEAEIAAW